ncbi:type II secretion system F family protein [Azospirillum sp. sgz301742]
MTNFLSDIQFTYLLLFGATLFLVEGLFYLYRDARGGTAATINRRLQLINSGKDRDTVLGTLRRADLDPASAVIVRVVPAVERLIREAGLTVTPKRVAVICLAVGALACTVLSATLTLPFALVLLASAVIGGGVPALVLMHWRRQRLKEFGAQMPEALEMMVRSLHAGHPIASALGMVASEMPDPAGSEFGIVIDEMTYGLDINVALKNLTGRIPHPDLAFFMVAVQIQHQTGGNLAEVLSNLASVIRDRFTMKMKVMVITAQGRSSAFVVALMPLLTAAGLNVISKGYFGDVADDPMFIPAMALAGVLWVLGVAIIVKLVNFRM